MNLSQARALLDAAVVPIIEPFDSVGNKVALKRLAHWSHQFAPLVATDEPNGITLEITGCEELLASRGGEEAFLDAVLKAIRKRGVHAVGSISSSLATAQACAYSGKNQVVADGREREVLALFRIEALLIPAAIVEQLHEVNVRTIGDVLALPRSSLPARYGIDLVVRLDEAIGVRSCVFDPVRPVASIVVERIFDGPVSDHVAIELASREALERLCLDLEHLERGARTIELCADRVDAPPWVCTIQLGRASRMVDHLWGLVRSNLERLPLDTGIESIAFRATSHERIVHGEPSLLVDLDVDHKGSDGQGVIAASFIDRVAARFGPGQLKQPRPLPGNMPEDEARCIGLDASLEPTLEPTALCGTSLRPTVLWRVPEPLRVEAWSDGDPHTVRWNGKDTRVAVAEGPERIGEAWWREDVDGERSYWRVQLDDGLWLWIFERHEKWLLHGVWS